MRQLPAAAGEPCLIAACVPLLLLALLLLPDHLLELGQDGWAPAARHALMAEHLRKLQAVARTSIQQARILPFRRGGACTPLPRTLTRAVLRCQLLEATLHAQQLGYGQEPGMPLTEWSR